MTQTQYEEQNMSVFNVEIEYPIHINGQDKVEFADLLDSDVLYQLDQVKWRLYRALQLQASGAKAVFSVTCLEHEHNIRLTLLDDTESGRVELKFESNIAVYESKKDLFGLLTRQVKQFINFERLNVEDARRYLTYFLLNNLDALIYTYKVDDFGEMIVA